MSGPERFWLKNMINLCAYDGGGAEASGKLVSVVIPAYNAARFLGEAIDSVLKQSYPDFEVIVVDDGSTDDTPSVLGSYANQIRVVRQENQGLSAARNAGIALARGEYIAFLDADDVWLGRKLELQVEALAEYPQASLIHTGAMKWDVGSGAESPFAKDAHLYQGACFNALIDHCSICVSSVMVRRNALNENGVFDPEIRRPTTQDYDLWLRLAMKGTFAYVDAPLVKYRVHESNASSSKEIMWEDSIFVLKKLTDHRVSLSAEGCVRVRSKIAELSFDLGYHLFNQGDFPRARKWLAQSAVSRPRVYPLILSVCSLFPSSLISAGRHFRNAMSRRINVFRKANSLAERHVL